MKYLILYGNCQSLFLHKILLKIPEVTRRWTVVHHNLWTEGEELARDLAQFDECDILLAQDISDWARHPRSQSLNPRTRLIFYPFCRNQALWPFYGRDPEVVAGEGDAEFYYGDALLARLRTEIPDPAERYRRYADLDVPRAPDIVRWGELEEDRLLREDERFGYTIGQWIIDNYRKRKIFHTVTHPAQPLWQRMAEALLEKLEIDAGPLDEVVEDYARGYEVPIHPKVVKALDLRWVKPDETYNFNSRADLTFEQYTRQYIRVFG